MIRLPTMLLSALLLWSLNPAVGHAVTYPTLVGHRGVGNPWTVELGIPEESIPAIKWAASHHADVVEGDVSITSDNKMVMMHDETIDRTTNRTGKVRERSLSYITDAWLELPVDRDGNGNYDNTSYHPPSLNYWLNTAKSTGKLVFLELKGSGWSKERVKEYVAVVNSKGMKDRVITAGNETKLSYFRSITGGGKRSWSVGNYPGVDKIRSVVGSSGYATISLADAEANPTYVKHLQTNGIRVFLWTLDNESHYRRAIVFGAYGWMCDNTNDAWKWLQENGA
jgi:glycerophosphoryl diester phosphodiesterase